MIVSVTKLNRGKAEMGMLTPNSTILYGSSPTKWNLQRFEDCIQSKMGWKIYLKNVDKKVKLYIKMRGYNIDDK